MVHIKRVVSIFFISILSITIGKAENLKYGVITNVSGDASVEVFLLREGKEIPVFPAQTILVGDKLLPTTAKVIVEYCNILSECGQVSGEKIFSTRSNTDYSETKLDHVISLLGLDTWKAVKYHVTHLVTRGDSNVASSELEVSLANMMNQPQYIFTGKRTLAFQWRNGVAPFIVKIKQQQDLVYSDKTSKQNIKTNLINWISGEYQLSITDKYNRTETTHFNVINKPLFVEQLYSFIDDGRVHDLNQYVKLGTMARVDGGRYALEAYQQLFPINSKSSSLLALQKAIGVGELFPDIKSEDVIKKLRASKSK